MHQNGKSRKQFAKLTGNLQKKQSLNKNSAEYREIIEKSIKVGKNIHTAFEESTLNSIEKQLSEKEAEIIKQLMEEQNYTLEQAKKFVDDNRKIEEKRRIKLAARRQKQLQNIKK